MVVLASRGRGARRKVGWLARGWDSWLHSHQRRCSKWSKCCLHVVPVMDLPVRLSGNARTMQHVPGCIVEFVCAFTCRHACMRSFALDDHSTMHALCIWVHQSNEPCRYHTSALLHDPLSHSPLYNACCPTHCFYPHLKHQVGSASAAVSSFDEVCEAFGDIAKVCLWVALLLRMLLMCMHASMFGCAGWQ